MTDVEQDLSSLREQGADRLDPVAFHFLEVLARRANQHQGSVQHILFGKLQSAIAAYRLRLESALPMAGQATKAAGTAPSPPPGLLAGLAGRFKRPVAGNPKNQALSPPNAASSGAAPHPKHLANAPREALKSVAYFRATWSKLSTHKQVAKAIDQAPANPGPINSHGLVLRSLAAMRDISPDYLNRFVNYADSLLCLGELGQDKPAVARPQPAASNTKKPAPRRASTRKPSGTAGR